MTNQITEKQHEEADVWLAEQMGEHVHKWNPMGTIDGLIWKCRDKSCELESFNPLDREEEPPTLVTPRSKDLSAMVNVADKLKLFSTQHEMILGTSSALVHKWGYNLNHRRWSGTSISENYRDHESPQHAAAWAIYLALREVKR